MSAPTKVCDPSRPVLSTLVVVSGFLSLGVVSVSTRADPPMSECVLDTCSARNLVECGWWNDDEDRVSERCGEEAACQ